MSLGRIVWHELVSQDAEGAANFYCDLFGWKRDPDHKAGSELRLTNGVRQGEEGDPVDYPVVHVTQLPEESRSDATLPNLWMVYVLVADGEERLDGALGRMRGTGLEPMGERVEGSGFRFHLLDSGNAALTVPLAHPSVAAPLDRTRHRPAVGCFCWNELTVHGDRLEALAKDLATAFDWTLDADRRYFSNGDQLRVAGVRAMAEKSEARIPDHWLPFVRVADVAATLNDAVELGGGEVVSRTPHPDHENEYCAVVGDPFGGVVGLVG